MTGDEDCDCTNPLQIPPLPLWVKSPRSRCTPHLDLVRREPEKIITRPAFRDRVVRGPAWCRSACWETPAGGVRAYSARVRARKRGRKSALLSVFVL